MLPIQLLVLVHQQQSQRQGQETRKEDERGADTHSFGVSGRIALVEDVGSEQGPALADEVQEHDPYASACVRALVVCLICEPPAFGSSHGVRWRLDLLRTQGRMFAIVGKIPAKWDG